MKMNKHTMWSTRNLKQKLVFPPGFEPGTFRVLGERDNHYTTETTLLKSAFLVRMDESTCIIQGFLPKYPAIFNRENRNFPSAHLQLPRSVSVTNYNATRKKVHNV